MALTQEECIAFLELIRWGNKPECPYCNSRKSTPIHKESRYHCNYCYTSYSVTVGTIFHKSHVELPKWFKAISLIKSSESGLSVRRLAREISVTKNTALSMRTRIQRSTQDDLFQIAFILKFYQDYIKREKEE
ncbi:transposase [Leptolyngbya sp. CCNP1308]|uniref:transposase n=1 Tax=Leptolyngbya sp. CCNP1308 TaxID=3110255 RepID=UPI003A59998B